MVGTIHVAPAHGFEVVVVLGFRVCFSGLHVTKCVVDDGGGARIGGFRLVGFDKFILCLLFCVNTMSMESHEHPPPRMSEP